MTDPSVEEIKGPTPAGGVRAVAMFRDLDGKPCAKDRARFVEITEYDAVDQVVGRTYGQIENPNSDAKKIPAAPKALLGGWKWPRRRGS